MVYTVFDIYEFENHVFWRHGQSLVYILYNPLNSTIVPETMHKKLLFVYTPSPMEQIECLKPFGHSYWSFGPESPDYYRFD